MLASMSRQGMLWVDSVSYEHGVLRVLVRFTTFHNRKYRLRIVVDDKPIATTVEPHQDRFYYLQAHPAQPLSADAVLSIQVIDVDLHALVDSVQFGQFSQGSPASTTATDLLLPPPDLVRSASMSTSTSVSSTSSLPEFPFGLRSHPLTPLPTNTLYEPAIASPDSSSSSKQYTIMRTTHAPSPDALQAPARLKMNGHLGSMACDWSPEEISAKRRLVQFWTRREHNILEVSFAKLAQADFIEECIVISCIYRSDLDRCYITSVDLIYLVEALIGSEFTIEEKNRVRRNLEGFKPETVAKHKANMEDFFTQIMDYAPPKPRNIEKNLKVFLWDSLQPALEKILSKYSAYECSSPDSPPDSDQSPMRAYSRRTQSGKSASRSGVSTTYSSLPRSQKPRSRRPPTVSGAFHRLPSPESPSDSEPSYDHALPSEERVFHTAPSLEGKSDTFDSQPAFELAAPIPSSEQHYRQQMSHASSHALQLTRALSACSQSSAASTLSFDWDGNMDQCEWGLALEPHPIPSLSEFLPMTQDLLAQ